jgi:signal transduction histidine kinase
VRATPHGVSLRCDPDLELDSYPGALSQVLTNLIVNALTHAYPLDGRAGTVTVTARADGPEHVRLVVADDGRGIDPSVRERLFEPFVTTNRGGGNSGLGMGIALTQATHVMGGSLSVDSAAEHGTRISLRLPRVAPRHEASEPTPATATGTGTGTGTETETAP